MRTGPTTRFFRKAKRDIKSPKKKGKDKPPRKPRAGLPEGSFLPLSGPQTRAEVTLDAPNEQAIATFNGTIGLAFGPFPG